MTGCRDGECGCTKSWEKITCSQAIEEKRLLFLSNINIIPGKQVSVFQDIAGIKCTGTDRGTQV